MKKYFILSLIVIALGVITMSQTCESPKVSVTALGTDFNITVADGKGCLSFDRTIHTDDAVAMLDSLIHGVIGSNDEIQLSVTRDSSGNFVLHGSGCAVLNKQSMQ